MADDKDKPEQSDRPVRVNPEQMEQHAQQSQASATVQAERRIGPARRPLFRC
jgi:hypothetical protein